MRDAGIGIAANLDRGSLDVLACARARGFIFREIPITWNNPPETRVNAWTYPKVLMETVLVGFKRLSGKYK